MLRTMAVEERLRRGRMEAKTRDAMIRAKIEVGAKCAPFVSQAILQTLKEVYPVEAEDLEPVSVCQDPWLTPAHPIHFAVSSSFGRS